MLFPRACDPTQGICHSLGGKQLAWDVMLGCWKLSQQPSIHPPVTLSPSSISFYLLLMPGLACQCCGFCSTTAARLGQPGLPAQPAWAFLAGLHFLPLSATEVASQAAPDTNCFSPLHVILSLPPFGYLPLRWLCSHQKQALYSIIPFAWQWGHLLYHCQMQISWIRFLLKVFNC